MYKSQHMVCMLFFYNLLGTGGVYPLALAT